MDCGGNMLKNTKPLITELELSHITLLKELGFYVERIFSSDKEIKLTDTFFQKNYSCCGGTFTLQIDIRFRHIFNGKWVGQTVKIRTPYDSWWCDYWNIADFTKDMEDFQRKLQDDLQVLRKNGIIS